MAEENKTLNAVINQAINDFDNIWTSLNEKTDLIKDYNTSTANFDNIIKTEEYSNIIKKLVYIPGLLDTEKKYSLFNSASNKNITFDSVSLNGDKTKFNFVSKIENEGFYTDTAKVTMSLNKEDIDILEKISIFEGDVSYKENLYYKLDTSKYIESYQNIIGDIYLPKGSLSNLGGDIIAGSEGIEDTTKISFLEDFDPNSEANKNKKEGTDYFVIRSSINGNITPGYIKDSEHLFSNTLKYINAAKFKFVKSSNKEDPFTFIECLEAGYIPTGALAIVDSDNIGSITDEIDWAEAKVSISSGDNVLKSASELPTDSNFIELTVNKTAGTNPGYIADINGQGSIVADKKYYIESVEASKLSDEKEGTNTTSSELKNEDGTSQYVPTSYTKNSDSITENENNKKNKMTIITETTINDDDITNKFVKGNYSRKIKTTSEVNLPLDATGDNVDNYVAALYSRLEGLIVSNVAYDNGKLINK